MQTPALVSDNRGRAATCQTADSGAFAFMDDGLLTAGTQDAALQPPGHTLTNHVAVGCQPTGVLNSPLSGAARTAERKVL